MCWQLLLVAPLICRRPGMPGNAKASRALLLLLLLPLCHTAGLF
jgi:hypothetical protein